MWTVIVSLSADTVARVTPRPSCYPQPHAPAPRARSAATGPRRRLSARRLARPAAARFAPALPGRARPTAGRAAAALLRLVLSDVVLLGSCHAPSARGDFRLTYNPRERRPRGSLRAGGGSGAGADRRMATVFPLRGHARRAMFTWKPEGGRDESVLRGGRDTSWCGGRPLPTCRHLPPARWRKTERPRAPFWCLATALPGAGCRRTRSCRRFVMPKRTAGRKSWVRRLERATR